MHLKKTIIFLIFFIFFFCECKRVVYKMINLFVALYILQPQKKNYECPKL